MEKKQYGFNPNKIPNYEPVDIKVQWNENGTSITKDSYHVSSIPDGVDVINSLIKKSIPIDSINAYVSGVAMTADSFLNLFADRKNDDDLGVPTVKNNMKVLEDITNSMEKKMNDNEPNAINIVIRHYNNGFWSKDVEYSANNEKEACKTINRLIDQGIKPDLIEVFTDNDHYSAFDFLDKFENQADINDAKEYSVQYVERDENGYSTPMSKDFATISDVKDFIDNYSGDLKDLHISKGFDVIDIEDVIDNKIQDADINDFTLKMADDKFMVALKKLLDLDVNSVKTLRDLNNFINHFNNIYFKINLSYKVFEKVLSNYTKALYKYLNGLKNNYIDNIDFNDDKESINKYWKPFIEGYEKLYENIQSNLKYRQPGSKPNVVQEQQVQEQQTNKQPDPNNEKVVTENEEQVQLEQGQKKGNETVKKTPNQNVANKQNVAPKQNVANKETYNVTLIEVPNDERRNRRIVGGATFNTFDEAAKKADEFLRGIKKPKQNEKNLPDGRGVKINNIYYGVSSYDGNKKKLVIEKDPDAKNEIISKAKQITQDSKHQRFRIIEDEENQNAEIDWRNELKYSEVEFDGQYLIFVLLEYPAVVYLDTSSIDVTVDQEKPSLSNGGQGYLDIDYTPITENMISVEYNADSQAAEDYPEDKIDLDVNSNLALAVDAEFEKWLDDNWEKMSSYDEY